jgi:PAS domain S-box-containing protein
MTGKNSQPSDANLPDRTSGSLQENSLGQSAALHKPTLRQRAEAAIQANETRSPQSEVHSPEAMRIILHELRVHQIELEMQNEELRRTQVGLDISRSHYLDLFDLAPAGYFTIDEQGLILEANLTVTSLVGVSRDALVKQPITRFIFKEDQDVYYLHRRQLLAKGKAHTCELRMVNADETAFWVRLTATTQVASEGSAPGTQVSRVVLSDISEQKQIERDKAKLDAQGPRAKKPPHADPKPGKAKAGKSGRDRKKAARK